MLFLSGEAPKRLTTDEIIQIITEGNALMPEGDFVTEGIKRLRKDPYRGINSVFSGLNEAFRKHFNRDPVEFTNRLANEGKVEVVPMRGGKGVMIYLPGEGPRGRKTDEALKKILA